MKKRKILTVAIAALAMGFLSSCEKSGDVRVTGVKILEKTVEITFGAGPREVSIAYQISPEDASDRTVSWTSSNPNVATIDNEGRVSAKSVGETEITVTTRDGGKTDTCKVTVIQLPGS